MIDIDITKDVIDLRGYTESINDQELIEIIQSTTNMRELNLSDCNNITNKSLIHIAHNLEHKIQMLESLTLNSITSHINKGVVEIIKKCKNLRLFSANSSHNIINDTLLTAIGQTCTKLCIFDVFALPLLSLGIYDSSNLGMIHITKNCRDLTYFNICGHHFIDDESIKFLQKSKLTHLILSLTSVSSSSFTEKMPNLKRVDLGAKITDQAMENIIVENSKLEEIRISASEQLTDKTLDLIMKRCSKLQYISLNSSNVSDAKLSQMEEHCKKFNIEIEIIRDKNITIGEISYKIRMSIGGIMSKFHQAISTNIQDTQVQAVQDETHTHL